ncbi:hypothetical protein BCS71_25775 [Vibrio lentus]|uniref:hypothetical protein n=1 Tax=Vibrio lentus TaxID=136468 RepID=UPI000C836A4E|nr:hypothetical protein [Vibrio lentus]PMI58277.1 hypothetical protein BCU41_03855 [Vibrio lentus]
MNKNETMDALDYIDLLTDKLDKVTGILFALEGCLSVNDIVPPKTSHAVSAALEYVEDVRSTIEKLGKSS